MTPGGNALGTDVNDAVKKCSGGQHHSCGAQICPISRNHAASAPVLNDDIVNRLRQHTEIFSFTNGGLHGVAIQLTVGLGARAVHGRALCDD